MAAALGLAACALQTHLPPSDSPARAQAELLAFRVDAADVRTQLASAGIDVQQWPLPSWDMAALHALAMARHPALKRARARLAEAQARQALASPTPWLPRGIELTAEHHDAVQGGGVSPWSLGVVLEFGLSDRLLGLSRQQARQDAERAAGDEAFQEAAQAAWQVHARVREAGGVLAVAQQRVDLAQMQWADRREMLAAWLTRLRLGAADASDLARIRREEAEAQRAADLATQTVAQARRALVGAVGLTPAQADGLPIAVTLSSLNAPAQTTAAALQQAALLNRLDVRAGVARYAAADAALRLALLRQWPEIVLKPGWAWDQGDRRWSLGVGLTLPAVGGNQQAINLARAQRDAEAAEFAVLQQQALSELDAAQLAAQLATGRQRQASLDLEAAQAHIRRSQQRLNAGSIDRLVWLDSRAEAHQAQARWIDALAAGLAARAALEDAMQRPLDGLFAPARKEARGADSP